MDTTPSLPKPLVHNLYRKKKKQQKAAKEGTPLHAKHKPWIQLAIAMSTEERSAQDNKWWGHTLFTKPPGNSVFRAYGININGIKINYNKDIHEDKQYSAIRELGQLADEKMINCQGFPESNLYWDANGLR